MSEAGAPPPGSSRIAELYDNFVAANARCGALDCRLANLAADTDVWAQAWVELEAASRSMEVLVASLADQPAASKSDLVLKAKALVTVLTPAVGNPIGAAEGHLRLALVVASETARLL
jgi:hypothetical protein